MTCMTPSFAVVRRKEEMVRPSKERIESLTAYYAKLESSPATRSKCGRKGTPVQRISPDGQVDFFKSVAMAGTECDVHPSSIRESIKTGARIKGCLWSKVIAPAE